MKHILLIIGVLGLQQYNWGQVTFQAQSSNTNQNLEGIFYKEFPEVGSIAWVCGTEGTLLKTTDDGQTWNALNSGTTSGLYDITFQTVGDSFWGWACGSSATVVATQDGGTSWGTQLQGAPNTMFAIDFPNLINGVTAGQNYFAVSANSGNNWSPINAGSPTFEGLDMVTGTLGWVCGDNGLIMQTQDGGTNWSIQYTGTTYGLKGIHFINSSEGWACGYVGTILHTTNGGNTWEMQTSNTQNLLFDIQFFDALNGWACGNAGTILRTTDGGETWVVYESTETGTAVALKNLSLVNGNTGIAVGQIGTIIHFSAPESSAVITNLQKEEVQIYPNPSTSLISIQGPKNIEKVYVFDQLGNCVQIENECMFSIADLPTGVYVVQILTGSSIVKSRFVKM